MSSLNARRNEENGGRRKKRPSKINLKEGNEAMVVETGRRERGKERGGGKSSNLILNSLIKYYAIEKNKRGKTYGDIIGEEKKKKRRGKKGGHDFLTPGGPLYIGER